MASEQELEKAISQAFVKTLRLTEVGQFYKGPEVLFLLSQKFPQLFNNGILNLEQLYQSLRDVKGVDADDLLGLMLVFKDQEASLGIQMQLPSDLLLMPADKKQKIYTKADADVKAHLLRRDVQEVPEELGESAPKKPIKGFKRVDKKKAARFQLIGAIVVGILLLASIIINIQTHQPPKPDLKPVVFDLSPFHLQGELSHKQSVYILKVKPDYWKAQDKYQLEKDIKDLTLALKDQGMRNLSIMTYDFHTLVVATPGHVAFIQPKEKAPPKPKQEKTK